MLPRACSGSLYRVLEVPERATGDEIKRSYRRLALQFHPDKTGGATTDAFKSIQEAYATLSDPDQRQLYDTLGMAGLRHLGSTSFSKLFFALASLRVIFVALTLLAAMLLITLVLGIVKLDRSKSGWPWAAVFAPIWPLCLLFALLGMLLLFTAVKEGSLVILLTSLEFLLLPICVSISVAVLSGAIPPIAVFIPWITWYTVSTVRHLHGCLPWEYERQRQQNAEATGSSSGMGGVDDSFTAIERGARGAYLTHVAHTVVEKVCVFSFFILACRRTMQGTTVVGGMSFWSAVSPLMALFSLRTGLAVWTAFCASSDFPRSSHDEYSSLRGNLSDTSYGSPGLLGRLFEALIAGLYDAGWLYMCCMWAARMEHDYNGVTTGFYPSAAVTLAPLLLSLSLLTLAVSCISCVLSSGVIDDFDTERDAASHVDTTASPAEGTGPTASPACYHSTDYSCDAGASRLRVSGSRSHSARDGDRPTRVKIDAVCDID